MIRSQQRLAPFTLAATVCGAALSALPAEAQAPPDLLVRAADRYESLRGMCASFDQRLEVPLLGTEVLSHGTLCSMRPAFFRMDFAEPDGDAIVADGEFLWVYFPSSQVGQVLRSPLGEGTEVDFTREFLSDPGVKYTAVDEGPEKLEGRSTRRFSLDPVSDDLGYTTARVWIDTEQALIRKVEIHQENGSVRHVTLSEIDLAPGMNPSSFRFDVPEGVRVMPVGEAVRDR